MRMYSSVPRLSKSSKNCTHNATQDIAPVGIFMTHSKINQDSRFILLDGVTELRFRDGVHAEKKIERKNTNEAA